MSMLSGKSKKASRYECTAIIVAAGSSNRFGSEDKLFADLAGAPVLAYSLRAFNRCEYIKDIIVVAESENIETVAALVRDYGIEKVSKVVCGGVSRLESALSGVSETDGDCGLVAIHDGARPLVTEKVIRETIENAKVYKAAIPVVPLRDTVKMVRGGEVIKTPRRSGLAAAQTPQVFDRDVINAALSKALADKAIITDDASAVEALGKKVKVCDGDERNIKITTPMDIKLAEELLMAGGYKF